MSLLPAPSEWSPLEEQFHTWDIVLVNPSGEKVLSLWSNINITETHEGIRTQIEVNAEEPAIPFIRELVTDLMFYRDRVLLYRLRVVDSEDILTRDAASVRFDCVSYDKLLERRILHEDWLLDDGDINAAWRLIDYTQRKQTFGITRGTTAPGSRRQRALDAGDDILTAINDFAQADGGYDWWIDANLKFWAAKPRRGKAHNVQWQLGGEVGEMTRVNPIEDYSSLIMATGANSEVRIPRADGNEDVYPPPDPQIVQLISKPLGLWEMTTSDTDVITTASLLEKALWHLGDKGAIRPTYKLALEPGVWTPAFGIGDTVSLRINTVRANVKVPIRIEELAINCSADGAEVISMSVRAEEPETPISAVGGPPPLPMLLAGDGPEPNGRTVARHRLSEADDLGALLRSLRKRLDRAERSRGIGGGAGAGILDGYGPPPASIGSPGDYYVDLTGQQLYGPKAEGTLGQSASAATTYWDHDTGGPVVANNVLLNQEVAIGGYCFKDMDIIAFRYNGAPTASPTLNVSFWDYDSGELMYRTTTPGMGSGGWVEIPPIHVTAEYATPGRSGIRRFAVSLGGASVPVKSSPRGDYGYPSWMVLYFGVLPAPLNTGPPGGTQSGAHSLDLQLMTRPSEGTIIGSEELGVNEGWPNAHFPGELGMNVYFWYPGWLLGWRYRRLENTPSPLTFRVWDETTKVSPGKAEVIAEITVDHEGEGEFEVRLPYPIYSDGFLYQDYLMISYGHPDGVPYANSTLYNDYPASGWWGFQNDAAQDDVVGKFPIYMPGYPAYKRLYIMPICQQEATVWPISVAARSGGLNEQSTRVELHHNIERPYSGYDYSGLRFYEAGPSHDWKYWTKDTGVPAWNVLMEYVGASGVGIQTDSWYDQVYTSVGSPTGDAYYADDYSYHYCYYYFHYDYLWWEQNCDLPGAPFSNYPWSYYMAYNEINTWEYYTYQHIASYGPFHGANVWDPETEEWSDPVSGNGGAGFFCEVAEINDGTMAAGAKLYAIHDDGLSGTSLQVTPRVIQACFPPDAVGNTWWGGDYAIGLTPKGCVVPLITAASATATFDDEPWQKQFFRQIGTNLVSFGEGVGTIGVPTGMAPPCVVNAQVEGVTVGGPRVAQAQQTGDYVITIALDTAFTGNLPINWTAEHAIYTFGTPPPSIDRIDNPYSGYSAGNYVEYASPGYNWPIDLISYGHTFVNGCILKDFTGATVGGPFTIVDVYPSPEYSPNYYYQRIDWNARTDWYLPGQQQQYRLTNPDGQVSAWNVIEWRDPEVVMAMRNMTATRAGFDAREDIDVNRYSNNPRLWSTANQLPAALEARMRTAIPDQTVKPRGGGRARKDLINERAAKVAPEWKKRRRPPDTEPPADETTSP